MTTLIVFWIMCGGIAALIASSKGGSGIIAFLVGLVFGPFGVIAAFFMGSEHGAAARKLAAGERKKCPRCAELVQPEALVCRFCGHEFSAAEALPTGGQTELPARTEAELSNDLTANVLVFGGIAAAMIFAVVVLLKMQ